MTPAAKARLFMDIRKLQSAKRLEGLDVSYGRSDTGTTGANLHNSGSGEGRCKDGHSCGRQLHEVVGRRPQQATGDVLGEGRNAAASGR